MSSLRIFPVKHSIRALLAVLAIHNVMARGVSSVLVSDLSQMQSIIPELSTDRDITSVTVGLMCSTAAAERVVNTGIVALQQWITIFRFNLKPFGIGLDLV